jgi:hypothetical protein
MRPYANDNQLSRGPNCGVNPQVSCSGMIDQAIRLQQETESKDEAPEPFGPPRSDRGGTGCLRASSAVVDHLLMVLDTSYRVLRPLTAVFSARHPHRWRRCDP